MNRLGTGLLCGALLFSPAAGAVRTERVRIESIRAYFLYETSGALSQDVMPPSQFSIWNTIIGEGSAKEPANDVLIGVVLTSPDNELNLRETLEVAVRDGEGKLLASRKIDRLFLKAGKLVRYVLVPNAACAGPLVIHANYGPVRKTARVDMACGE